MRLPRIPRHMMPNGHRRSSTHTTHALPVRSPPTPPASPPLPAQPPPPYNVDPSIAPLPVAEKDAEEGGMIQMFLEDFRSVRAAYRKMSWKELGKKLIQKSMFKWYAIISAAIVLTVLISAKHDEVVKFCHPITKTIRSWPAGWMIPIVLLVVVSFPPLVGHEIIGILVGLVWGIGAGFAILAAGTFFGEVLLWIAFKWCCQARAAKFEKSNKLYGSLTQLIREKTFMFVLVLRFSAIPGHITTAVSASAGANFWSYLAAAFLTLPKQLSIVYIGQAFGQKTKKHSIVSTCMLVLTILGTGVAAVYIYYQMRMVMRRRGAMLPMTTADLATQPAAPTWDDLAKEDVKTDAIHMMELNKNPDGGSSMQPQMAAALHSRRPWLFTANSYASTTSRSPLRAWSMPGHMSEEELREWREEMESGQNTPMVRVENEEAPVFDDAFYQQPPSPTKDKQRQRDDLALGPEQDYDTSMTDSVLSGASGSLAAASAFGDNASLASSSRSARLSLDLERPSFSPRRGGREIADEADTYAMSKGARRPDLGRLRGESRAALLGRPSSPLVASTPISRRRSEEGSSTPSFREEELAPDEEFDSATQTTLRVNTAHRDYNRSRGDSGAALMGRPTRDRDSSPESVVSKNSL